MLDFVSGEIDVLVSTIIIETGLDIPNVNTIIVDNADTFGLSGLYQLRGRVGRSGRTAYALCFIKKDRVLSEVAEKKGCLQSKSSRAELRNKNSNERFRNKGEREICSSRTERDIWESSWI